jgi:hypothetical protein
MTDGLRARLQVLYSGGDYDSTQTRIEYYGERSKIPTAPDARDALQKCLDWFLDYADRQKELSGLEAIPRRGYEMVSKVSLILAAQQGLRTVEHVRWAFALAKRDVDTKIAMVLSNDATTTAQVRLYADLSKIIAKDHGETIGVIHNKLRKYKNEDIDKALAMLLAQGKVDRETIKGRNGKETSRWTAKNG